MRICPLYRWYAAEAAVRPFPRAMFPWAQIMDLSLNAGMDPSGVYVKTTGAVLWETVEWGLSCLIAQDPETGAISADGSYHGRYPNLAGAVYTYDIRKEGSTPLDFDPETYKMGSRLVSLTLDDGTEITKDSDVELILCTNEFELGRRRRLFLPAARRGGGPADAHRCFAHFVPGCNCELHDGNL